MRVREAAFLYFALEGCYAPPICRVKAELRCEDLVSFEARPMHTHAKFFNSQVARCSAVDSMPPRDATASCVATPYFIPSNAFTLGSSK